VNTKHQVVVTGAGITCALGNSLQECGVSLENPMPAPQSLSLNYFEGPISMPWYGIRSEHELQSEIRFYQIVKTVVEQALNEAALGFDERERIPLFLGSSSFEVGVSEFRYRNALANKRLSQGQFCDTHIYPIQIASMGHLLGYLRRQIGLRGPDFTFGTACSASANALISAARYISAGRANHAIVLGVELYNLTTLSGFHSLQLLAQDQIRPFDINRQGMILGEGCAAVVLSAPDSLKNSRSISKQQIELIGGASLCDTTSITATNTDGESIASVIDTAMQGANLNKTDITWIKTHGTASQTNDLAEANGMHRVFSELPELFALKPYVGHTLGACGVLELVLCSLLIKQKRVPSTPGFSTIDPQLNIEFCSADSLMKEHGIGLLNYFGFGGNNSVLVLRYGPAR